MNRIPLTVQDSIIQDYPDHPTLHELVRAGGPIQTIIDIVMELRVDRGRVRRHEGGSIYLDHMRRHVALISTLSQIEPSVEQAS